MNITVLKNTTQGRFPSSTSQQLDYLLYNICEKLQLNESQYKMAKERYIAISDWLSSEGSPLHGYKPRIYPQGSLKIGTTVKPKGRDEYDLDLVCELRVDHRLITPHELIVQVWDRITSHETYKSMAEAKKRCIRLNYKKEFHLDILPACLDTEKGGTCVRIPNYDKINKTWNWEKSNPLGYAAWFERRCQLQMIKEEAIEGIDPIPRPEHVDEKPILKLFVQLIKRWRDITFDNQEQIPSIILTTLAGELYKGEQTISECIPTILNDLVFMTRQSPDPLKIINPSNEEERLSEKWERDPNIYYRFCQKIKEFYKYWINLLQYKGIDRVASALYVLFGEDIVSNVIAEYAQKIQEDRQNGNIYVSKNNGLLTNSKTKTLPVRRNTFYGI